MSRRSLGRDALDARIRAHENEVYEHFGLLGRERTIRVLVGRSTVDVRIVEFGPTESRDVPVLLLHGIGSVSVFGAELVLHLPGRRVIAVDWPGHGLSGTYVLPKGTAVRDHAVITIRSVLEVLSIPVVDVVGHSLGGQFGLYAALDLRDRVRRIALVGAPGAAFEGVRPLPVMVMLAIPGIGARLLSAPMSEKAFIRNTETGLGAGALGRAPHGLVSAGRLIARRRGLARSVASFFRALIRRSKIRDGVAIPISDLHELALPVLLVWGDQDVFQTPASASRSISAIRDAHLVEIPGAGHAPWLQEPELVGQAVAAHLADG
ncbi:MAG: hypothetical protein JWP74_3167 [Marmoricola sp.]|nr:hypothetical protein [Marmoricola sp.]